MLFFPLQAFRLWIESPYPKVCNLSPLAERDCCWHDMKQLSHRYGRALGDLTVATLNIHSDFSMKEIQSELHFGSICPSVSRKRLHLGHLCNTSFYLHKAYSVVDSEWRRSNYDGEQRWFVICRSQTSGSRSIDEFWSLNTGCPTLDGSQIICLPFRITDQSHLPLTP